MRVFPAVVLVVAVAQAAANYWDAKAPNQQDKDSSWAFSWTDPCNGHESQYTVVTTRMGFQEAELYCQTEFNGHLASPSTESEDNAIRMALFRFPLEEYSFFWFGGIKVEDHWEFANGQLMEYTGWYVSAPAETGGYAAFWSEATYYDWVNFPQDETPIGAMPQWAFICEA